MQAAGGVHDDHVAGGKFGFFDGAAHDFERFVSAFAGPNRRAHRFGDLGELFARRGAVDVGGNDQRAMAVLGEPLGKLSRGGGFAGALQADDHPDRRRARSEQRLGVFAEHGGEFVANGLDHLLVGRKLQHDFAADRFLANVGEQFVGDADVDVPFEQGFANFGEGGVQVLFGELALAAKILEGALKLFCQVFKHGLRPTGNFDCRGGPKPGQMERGGRGGGYATPGVGTRRD